MRDAATVGSVGRRRPLRSAVLILRIMTRLLGCYQSLIEIGPVGAERFLREERAGRGVRARAASAADGLIAAHTTLPFVGIRIAQQSEHFGVVPDVGESLRARVACRDRQVTTRIHSTFVRDETDARSRQAS